MAAQATEKPPAGSPRHPNVSVEQPPRRIMRGGEWVDISHLDPASDEFYQAITSDEEPWDYRRLSAETGRSVVRIRKWVSNAYMAERVGRAEDDKTFIQPDGYTAKSPWWRAGHAREVLMQIGVLTRAGEALPYRPTGRTPGAQDLAPRKRWEHAPLRDTAAGIYREYKKLTTRKRNPLRDLEARAELCRKHNLTRTQLARRINTGREQVEGTPAPEVDKAALQARLAELVAELVDAGYSASGADDRARAALAEETGLTRRQLAGYLAADQAAATDKTGG